MVCNRGLSTETVCAPWVRPGTLLLSWLAVQWEALCHRKHAWSCSRNNGDILVVTWGPWHSLAATELGLPCLGEHLCHIRSADPRRARARGCILSPRPAVTAQGGVQLQGSFLRLYHTDKQKTPSQPPHRLAGPPGSAGLSFATPAQHSPAAERAGCSCPALLHLHLCL